MTWRSQELLDWLDATRADNGDYRHCRLDDREEGREEGLNTLRDLVDRAHADARDRLADLAGIDLHPLGRPGAAGSITYPDDLHTSTLQGYLGEIIAGLVAENWEPHGRPWEVPAFLFRVHFAAFQALERRRQLGGVAQPVPGRTGDDCVAFVRDEEGRITEWLMCEAKCAHDHDSDAIREGHKQLSKSLNAPVDLLQLIEIMEDSDELDAGDWVDALRLLLQDSLGGDPADRLDLLMYVCGRSPVKKESWLSAESPHEDYEGDGPLEAVELHLREFDEVLEHVYPGHKTDR